MAVRERHVWRKVVGLVCAVSAVAVGCTASTPRQVPQPTASAERPAIALAVRLVQGSAPRLVAGLPRRMALTVRNLTSQRQTGLVLALSDTVDGSPGSADERQRPALVGRCTAGAGTSYCPLPALMPRAVYRATITATVPMTLAGRSTVGGDFVQTVFVATKTDGQPVTPVRRLRLRIVATATSFPDAGAGDRGPAGALAATGSIPLGAPASLLVTAGPDVYTLEPRGQQGTRVEHVAVPDRRVVSTRTLAGTPVSASIGRTLVVLTRLGRRDGPTTGPAVLTVLDARSLRVLRSRRLRDISSVVTRPQGIYTAIPGKLLELDPLTLATVRTLTIDADPQQPVGAQLGADPRSHIIYLGIPCGCVSQPVVDVVDFDRWAVIGRTHVPAVVDAVPQGVGDDAWLTYATGMMAAIQRITPLGRTTASRGGVGSNSTTSVVTGTRLWTFNALDPAVVVCDDLATGQADAHSLVTGDATAFGADDNHVYVAIARRLQLYRPAGRCAAN